MNPNLNKIRRKIDSLFDLTGDVGGFMEAIRAMAYILAFSYNAYALESTLAFNLVRYVPSLSNTFKDSEKDRLK